MRRTILLLASVAVAMVLASGVAFALVTFAFGGPIERVAIARESSASSSNSTAFVDIPGASVSVFVPSGATKLIMARYSAESVCFGGTGLCSVRIVARNSTTGAITLLQPAASGAATEFVFDSTDAGRETGSSWESHSTDRSLRLGAGSYTIRAQRAVTSSATTFRLDDWSLTVEQSQ